MADMLVVRSKIKDYVKDMNVSGDFSDALSKKCETLIKEAIERAKANGRRTVQSRDL
jgi:histone H3/H4